MGVCACLALVTSWIALTGSIAAAADDTAGSPLADQVERAIQIVGSGQNLFEAYRILHRISPQKLRKEAPRSLWRYWWAVGRITYELGRYDELETAVEKLLALPDRAAGHLTVLQGLYYRASGALADPHRFAPETQAVADLKTILEKADPGGSPLKVLALLALGKLEKDDARARDYLDRARRMAVGLGRDDYLFHIRAEIARRLARTDPAAGYAELQSALKDWKEADKPWAIYGWEARLEVVWAARPKAEAVKYSLDLLDRIESRRREQEERGAGSMGFFSVWVRAYRRVIGLLLRDSPVSRDSLELAFRLSERMRARLLLEDLHDRTGVSPACTSSEAESRLHALRQLISDRQRSVLTAPGDDQTARLREIDNLMLDEESIRRDIHCESGHVDFVELPDLERSLTPREALLIFQSGNLTDHYGAYDGGSWVFIVTAAGSTVLPLPEDRTIRLKRDAFIGSIRRRDGSDAVAAAALYHDLFRGIEATLPSSVRRLIIVPHGSIHGIPFAALRPAPGAPPLIERYRFSYAPSATIWWNLQHVKRPARRTDVMAFADPALGPGERAAWRHLRHSDLVALPWARKEAHALLRSYGQLGWLFEGPDATELTLRQADLEDTGFLLFAAHAVVDKRAPRRSAIVLALGNDDDDGLLQPPEISELPLNGTIVALSGCQSATGMAIEGEGLLSLARSFFEAGSTSVVGNLWPARDDETGRLFSGIYRNLAGGDSIGKALQRSQQARFRAGAPTEAWAGIVVLGNGRARIPRSPNRRAGSKSLMLWLGLLAAAALAFSGLRLGRRALRFRSLRVMDH